MILFGSLLLCSGGIQIERRQESHTYPTGIGAELVPKVV